MKARLFFVVMLVTSVLSLTSCSNDNEEETDFNWPIEYVYGVWDIVAIKFDNQWLDITTPELAPLGATIVIRSDGTCSFSGSMGYGSGTYKAYGKTIRVNSGDAVIYYDIISFAPYNAEVVIRNKGVSETMHVMVAKH